MDGLSESCEDMSLNNHSVDGPEYDPASMLEGFLTPLKEKDEFELFS